MLSKCGAGWQFYADCFRADCESGLVAEGETLTLPNGFVADFDGSRVRVCALHFDCDGVYRKELQTWEVTRSERS